MTTPIIMLVLLMGPYAIASLVARGRGRTVDSSLAAAVGLGLLFLFTGVGHFVRTEPMARMLPEWVPERVLLVYATGVLELAVALGFFLPPLRRVTAYIAAALLILFFPVNVYAALARVPMGGHAWGPIYLLIRGPLQIVILFWVYRFLIGPASTGGPGLSRRHA